MTYADDHQKHALPRGPAGHWLAREAPRTRPATPTSEVTIVARASSGSRRPGRSTRTYRRQATARQPTAAARRFTDRRDAATGSGASGTGGGTEAGSRCGRRHRGRIGRGRRHGHRCSRRGRCGRGGRRHEISPSGWCTPGERGAYSPRRRPVVPVLAKSRSGPLLRAGDGVSGRIREALASGVSRVDYPAGASPQAPRDKPATLDECSARAFVADLDQRLLKFGASPVRGPIMASG